MAEKPTKPLFTARFTLLNTAAYSQAAVLNAFRPDLEKAGYKVYQTPAVKSYTAKYTLKSEKQDDGSIFEQMNVMGPAGKETAIGKNLTDDPMGSRPILEQRKPIVTALAWNIAPPLASTQPQALADLLWEIRRTKVMDKARYTGLGWVPVVATWVNTPVKLSPYPDRPEIPQALLPVPTPKPAPVIPPPPEPDRYIPPPPPVFNDPVVIPKQASWFSDWRVWAVLAGIVTYGAFSDD